MKRFLLAFVFALPCALAVAAPLPYDESADARADIRNAIVAARADRVPVLIIFGANWCKDCRALDTALKSPGNAAFIAREFKVVKVDVGKFDRNLDLALAYGNPIKKGIPAVVVLSPDMDVVYVTRAGELADARRMSERGIYDFFKGITQTAKSRQK